MGANDNAQEVPTGVGGDTSAISQLVKAFFSGRAPQQSGGGANRQVESKVTPITMPATNAQPAGGMPAAPNIQAQPQQQLPQNPGGQEFRTGSARGGAVVGGAMGSIFGAISNITNKKKQDNIEHAKFLYELVKNSYDAGDTQTANTILQDPKNLKMIEHFLTGKLPRVAGDPGNKEQGNIPLGRGVNPGSQNPGSVPTMQKKQGEINQPGGVALPRPGPAQERASLIEQMKLKRLKEGDKLQLDQDLGEGSSLSAKDYEATTLGKFGIALLPAQVQMMDAQAQTALESAKVDMIKFLAGKQADADRAAQIAGMYIASDKEIAEGKNKASKYATDSRYSIAFQHLKFLQEVKKTTEGDKMDSVIYSGLSKLYTSTAVAEQKSEEQAEKLGLKDAAKKHHEEALRYTKLASDLGNQYKAGKFLDRLMAGMDPEAITAAEADDNKTLANDSEPNVGEKQQRNEAAPHKADTDDREN